MKKILLTTLLILIAVAAAAAASSGKSAREVIVKWKQVPVRLSASALLPDHAGKIESLHRAFPVKDYNSSGLERITVLTLKSSTVVAELLRALESDSRVEYAEPRAVRTVDGRLSDLREPGRGLDGVPDDPFYPQQWGLHRIEAEAAWDVTRGSEEVVIAVLDLGVDFTHPELEAARWINEMEEAGQEGVDDDLNGFVDDIYGYDFVGKDGCPDPEPREIAQSHGTHVSGIIAAARNNGRGITGIAPRCRIMNVRVGEDGDINYGYEGFYYAAVSGARIINCSWGGDKESAYERDMVDFALSQGCVVVASAGNTGNQANLLHYPAALENVVAVGATTQGDVSAEFSQFGKWVDISAPGVAILSTVITDEGLPGYASWQGTSMAAPLAAGVCGLIAARFPGLNNRGIVARVLGCSDLIDAVNLNRTGDTGRGRVNAWRAVSDSDPAGLRIGDVDYEEISGNGDGRIQGGETARLTIPVFNDGAAVSGVYGEISTKAEYAVVQSDIALYGDLPPGGPYPSDSPGFEIHILDGAPHGYVVPLTVQWFQVDGGLLGRTRTVVCLDSTFVILQNDGMRIGFAENGCLGYYDYVQDQYLGAGWGLLERPAGALYHGSFLLGADGIVLDNFYGNGEGTDRFDWVTMPDSTAYLSEPESGMTTAAASFDDRGAPLMLFAGVEAGGIAVAGPDDRDYFLLEYTVTNRSLNPWTEAYAGLILDLDLGASSQNILYIEEADGLIYIRNDVPCHPLAGIASITDAWSGISVIDNRAELDPPAVWNDQRKWELITGGISVPPSTPMDLSVLAVAGPVTVASHEIKTFVFALVTGNSPGELTAAAEQARNRYFGNPDRQKQPSGTENPLKQIKVYPNPLTAEENLRIETPVAGPVILRVYNILGQQVREIQGRTSSSGTLILNRSVLGEASGLLFYRLETGGKMKFGKLLVLN